MNTIILADCVHAMGNLDPASVDFVLTDPPYLVTYCDRSGRTVTNDDNARWLRPAFSQIYRVLKPASFCVSFYAWNKVHLFMAAWRDAGFRAVGHIVFRKRYASSARFLRYQHEAAYLLAKGDVKPPAQPIPDVIDFHYTGNKLHPTQKPIDALKPLISTFCPPDGVVLDPFAGSGSTLVAAK
jgi:DNA modification methylase